MPAKKPAGKKTGKKPAKKTKEERERAKGWHMHGYWARGEDVREAYLDEQQGKWGAVTGAAVSKHKPSLAKVQLASAKYRRYAQDAKRVETPVYAWTKGESKKLLGKKLPGKLHQPKLTNNIKGMSDPMIRRLCLRGGIKRVSRNVYETVRTNMQAFVDNALDAALVFTRRMKHNTVTQDDIVRGLAAKGYSVSPAVTTQRYTYKKKKTSSKKPAAKAEAREPEPEADVLESPTQD